MEFQEKILERSGLGDETGLSDGIVAMKVCCCFDLSHLHLCMHAWSHSYLLLAKLRNLIGMRCHFFDRHAPFQRMHDGTSSRSTSRG